MKAVVINQFGSPDVLELTKNHPEPTLSDNQVLIKVHAAGVNPLDLNIRKGKLKLILGSKFPIVLGNDASGIVVRCGTKVTKFREGDAVYGMVDSNPSFSHTGFAKSGSYAEYAVTREDTLALKPPSLSFEEAASLPLCSLTAYQTLVYKAQVKPGQKVLIHGASGGVGIFALQIAKNLGAEVYAVCSSQNVDLVKSFGADRIIDYRTVDVKRIHEKFDVVYDIALTLPYAHCKNLLTPKGIFISNLANPINVLLFPIFEDMSFSKRKQFAWVRPTGADLSQINEWVEAGRIRTFIDKVYSLNEVRAAHDDLEARRTRGKLVIGME